MTDLLEEIRQRDNLKGHSPAGVTMTQAEADRRTLLRLLDATREELFAATARLDRIDAEDDTNPDLGDSATRTSCAGIWMTGIVPADEARASAIAHYTERRNADQAGLDRIDAGEPVTYWRGDQRFDPADADGRGAR